MTSYSVSATTAAPSYLKERRRSVPSSHSPNCQAGPARVHRTWSSSAVQNESRCWICSVATLCCLRKTRHGTGQQRPSAKDRGIALDCHIVGSDGDLRDVEGRWPTAYGIGSSGAVLVRPDGFVAARWSDGNDAQAKLNEAVKRLALGKASKKGRNR